MSKIQNLGQQVSDLAADSQKAAATLNQMAQDLKKLEEIIRRSMQGTSQRNYWNIINQLSFARTKLSDAAACLETASRSGNNWVALNISGGTSRASAPNPGNSVWQGTPNTNSGEQFDRPDPVMASQYYTSAMDAFDQAGVCYNSIHSFGRDRTAEEIISRLGGGDNTSGSCTSLAFAYIGNLAGYDVLDFRDGKSRELFSKDRTIEKIVNLPGVDAQTINGKDEVACTNKLLNTVLPGREYCLVTGLHTAIIKINDDHFEYLELQHPTKNGWHYLDDYELLKRFGCERSLMFDSPNYLIDVSTLRGNREFLDLLGYLNTPESEQHKGVNGYVR